MFAFGRIVHSADWLRRYLRISFVPQVFTVLQTWNLLEQRGCFCAVINITRRQQKGSRTQIFPNQCLSFRIQTSARFANVAWRFVFARFLIQQPTCTEAFIAVESMLSSAPLLDVAQISKISLESIRSASGRSRYTQSGVGRMKVTLACTAACKPHDSIHMNPNILLLHPVWAFEMIGRIISHSLSVSS